MRLGLALGMALALALGGCAELTSVYHNRSGAPAPRAITLDAYQRSVFIVPERETTPLGETKLRICAEAAPDTFAALSASIAAEGSLVEKQARITAAINQSGATIERTQTINLLRESLYRTCERYLSGAISKETLIVQAARDQRAMVAVLAIEQLTRTVRPPATVISAGTTSASVPNTELVSLVADLRKEETAAKGMVGAAEKAFTDAGGPKTCEAAKPVDDSGPIKQADWQKCDDAKTALAARKAELATASGRVEKALKLGGDSGGGGAIAAATEQGPNNAGGGGGVLKYETIKAVADAVVEIANQPNIDETLMFCIAYLDEHPKDVRDTDIVTGCIQILKSRAKLDNDYTRQFFSVSSSTTDIYAERLDDYFSVAEDKFNERMKRAQAAAKEIGLPASERDITDILASGSALDRKRLVKELLRTETDADALAILKP